MGWNSWNPFGMNVSEKVIRETADAMVSSGLMDAGFTYIVIDDYWQGTRDTTTGILSCNPDRFPSGIKTLADYVHSKGLKFGIYSDAGTMTCGDNPGSYGYEENDAKMFAGWGIDYLKYDYCYCPDYGSENNDYKMAIGRYRTMGDALKATHRPIIYSICEWGPRSPWLWGKEVGGHLWRISYDVGDKWDEPRNEHSQIGILTAIDAMTDLERFAGPGGWNDPDMLVIGLKNEGFIKGGGCSDEEYRTQMSMWCMFSAPLILGCDVRNMTETTKSILLNKDIISIDQDSLGKQAFRVLRLDGMEAWKKPLSGNRIAMAFLNRNSRAGFISVTLEQLELDPNVDYEAYDVWKHETVKQPEGGMAVTLKPHECYVFILTE
ncbi:MAG: glycoside hydrolase family 27 protein [Bacteroidales bacterium]|nr:glycoside hydrolase family 27 protein [Bacteroidales bacterium]